jgi:hypothetical protein
MLVGTGPAAGATLQQVPYGLSGIRVGSRRTRMNRLQQALIVVVAGLFCLILAAADVRTAGKVQVQFTTRPTGQNYSPRHVLAVWVTDANGGFVRTLLLQAAQQRNRLVVWQQNAPQNLAGLTDAMTGATARTHETVRVEWDCCNAAGKLVPDGRYFIMVEFTERNGAGPVLPRGYLQVEKGPQPFTFKPKKLNYFKDLAVVYTPQAAGAAPGARSK